jgi:hypothetical protein
MVQFLSFWIGISDFSVSPTEGDRSAGADNRHRDSLQNFESGLRFARAALLCRARSSRRRLFSELERAARLLSPINWRPTQTLHARRVFATATHAFASALKLCPVDAIAAGIWKGRVGPSGLARRGEGERGFDLRRVCAGNAIEGADHCATSPSAGSAFAGIHSGVI